jgi:poly [ADP-ribose] polymerase
VYSLGGFADFAMRVEDLFANPALADEQHNSTYDEAVEAISNSYYTIIPNMFGRQRPPVVHDGERLMREVAFLESLANMDIATTIMDDTATGSSINALDRQFAGLGLQEMTPRKSRTEQYVVAASF